MSRSQSTTIPRFRDGRLWRWPCLQPHSLRKLPLTVPGLGRVATAVAAVLAALGVTVLWWQATTGPVRGPDTPLPACSFRPASDATGTCGGGCAFNISACIAPACYSVGLRFCNISLELECLRWMTSTSDCVQGGAPAAMPAVADQVTQAVRYHMYWSGPLSRVAMLSVKSFLVTQPDTSTLTIWTGGHTAAVATNALDRRILSSPRVQLRRFEFLREWQAIAVDFPNFPANFTLRQARMGPSKHNAVVGYSDLVRLLVLYRYGGVYVDMDVLFLRDFMPLLQLTPFAYTWGCVDDKVNTAVFALAARSPVARSLVDGVVRVFFSELSGDSLTPLESAQDFSNVATKITNATLQLSRSTFSMLVGAFHPYRLTEIAAKRRLQLYVLSSYLVDPTWMLPGPAKAAGLCLGAPCNAWRQFEDFFSLPTAVNISGAPYGATSNSPASPKATSSSPLLPIIPADSSLGMHSPVFCDPAFAYHWHNQWGTVPSQDSQAYRIELWLHQQLRLGSDQL